MSEKEKAKPALDGLGTGLMTNTSHPAPGSREEKNKLQLPPPRVDHITQGLVLVLHLGIAERTPVAGGYSLAWPTYLA